MMRQSEQGAHPIQYEFRGKTLAEAVGKSVGRIDRKASRPMPASRAVPFCKPLFRRIERAQERLADAAEAFANLPEVQREELDDLPNAAVAYARLAGDIAGFVSIARVAVLAVRGARISTAAKLGGGVGLEEIAELIFGVDSLINNWRDVSRVRALRDARRLKRELQSAERHLDNLLSNWNNAQCSLYIDESGRIIP